MEPVLSLNWDWKKSIDSPVLTAIRFMRTVNLWKKILRPAEALLILEIDLSGSGQDAKA